MVQGVGRGGLSNSFLYVNDSIVTIYDSWSNITTLQMKGAQSFFLFQLS